MRARDLREFSNEELRAQLKQRQDDILNFRLQMTTSSLENVRAGRNARRDVARIKTILRERELAKAQGAEKA